MSHKPTLKSSERLTIVRGEWYGWTMWPAYGDVLYHSPIEALAIRPHGNGSRRFDLEFLNAAYAHGVQTMEHDLQTLVGERSYLLAKVVDSDRTVAFVPLSLQWFERHMPYVCGPLSELVNEEGHSLGEAIRRFNRG